MTWFKMDDSFGSHPKVLGIPRKDRAAAIGLWAMAGVWCARNLTDGYLGEHMVDELGVPKRYAAMLVNAGLWDVESDGYRFHDWHDYQPSAADMKQARARLKDSGAFSAHLRWHVKRGVVGDGCGYCAKQEEA